MGRIVQFIKSSRPRRDRSRDIRCGNVVIFPGVRYERENDEQNNVRAKRKRREKRN